MVADLEVAPTADGVRSGSGARVRDAVRTTPKIGD
jgi:hypothetical protein